jgi:hypothetical protein
MPNETGLQAGLRGVKLRHPLVAQAQEALHERLEAPFSRGLLARPGTSCGGRGGGTAPHRLGIHKDAWRRNGRSACRGRGCGYGRCELVPGSDLDLLFLLPERSQSSTASATAASINAVAAARVRSCPSTASARDVWRSSSPTSERAGQHCLIRKPDGKGDVRDRRIGFP